jgi:membrane protease YdiL (CAAX protease family)
MRTVKTTCARTAIPPEFDLWLFPARPPVFNYPKFTSPPRPADVSFPPVHPARHATGTPKVRLALECAAIFIGLPGAHALGWLPVPALVLLLVVAAGCWIALGRHRRTVLANLRARLPGVEWRRILLGFALSLPLLATLLWLIQPEALFGLIKERPGVWLLLMVIYPFVSVLPQELVYRVYFFRRYEPLFGAGTGRLVASALAFGLAHVVFHNWPAVGLTLLGGWLFGVTYQRTASLLLVTVQHTLYGAALFTLGYHEFLHDGTLRLLPQ